MLLLGLIVAVSVHIIGALLVMALLVTPAAAAMRIASGPSRCPLLAALFGFVSAVGGILLAIAGTLPGQPVHHDDLVRDLRRVPRHRLAARSGHAHDGAARSRASPGRARPDR